MLQSGAVQHIPALERGAEGQYVFCRLKPWSYLNINARFSASGPQIQHFLRLTTGEAAVCGVECFVGKHTQESGFLLSDTAASNKGEGLKVKAGQRCYWLKSFWGEDVQRAHFSLQPERPKNNTFSIFYGHQRVKQ